MAFTNRSKDVSEQKQIYQSHYQAQVGLDGTTLPLFVCSVPFPSILKGVEVAAKGVSNAVTLDLFINRFTTAGITYGGGATTLTLQNVGVSGIQAMVLAASGSSLLSLQKGDVIQVLATGTSGAVSALSLGAVLQAVQDIKSSYTV